MSNWSNFLFIYNRFLKLSQILLKYQDVHRQCAPYLPSGSGWFVTSTLLKGWRWAKLELGSEWHLTWAMYLPPLPWKIKGWISGQGDIWHWAKCPLPRIGEQKVYFYFLKRPERYNQEVFSHSFICLPLPHMEGIVLICNIDLYCVIAIFNGTGDMFNWWHFYTLNTNWSKQKQP